MKFHFKARLDGSEKVIFLEYSFDVFSSNAHEISSYISELGGYMDGPNSAVLYSSENLAKLTTKLLSL